MPADVLLLPEITEKMISASVICEIAKLQQEISLKWVAASGEVIVANHAVPTSFHGDGQTFNVKLLPSGEIRKVNRFTVIELNGEEVIL